MPTPALPAPGDRAAPAAAAAPGPAEPPAAADRPVATSAPAPRWVGPYLVLCFVVSLLGAAVLAWLKIERHW
jgi:hypothetical protein